MANLIVKKIDNTTITIEDVLKGTKMIDSAEYRADGNKTTGIVSVRKVPSGPVYFYHFSQIEVDELGVLPSIEETVQGLNKFIGSFKNGGGASGGTPITEHNDLDGRDDADCHTISATTGLRGELDSKIEDAPKDVFEKLTYSIIDANVTSNGVCYVLTKLINYTVVRLNRLNSDGTLTIVQQFNNAPQSKSGRLLVPDSNGGMYVGLNYALYYLNTNGILSTLSSKVIQVSNIYLQNMAFGINGNLFIVGESSNVHYWDVTLNTIVSINTQAVNQIVRNKDGNLYAIRNVHGSSQPIALINIDNTVTRLGPSIGSVTGYGYKKDGSLTLFIDPIYGQRYTLVVDASNPAILNNDIDLSQTYDVTSSSAVNLYGMLVHKGKSYYYGNYGIAILDEATNKLVRTNINTYGQVVPVMGIGQDGKLYASIYGYDNPVSDRFTMVLNEATGDFERFSDLYVEHSYTTSRALMIKEELHLLSGNLASSLRLIANSPYLREYGNWVSVNPLKSTFENALNERIGAIDEKFNILQLKNSPHLWQVGTEYDFGDGSYGQVFTGNIIATASTAINTALLPAVTGIISYTGWWQDGNGVSKYQIPCAYVSTGGNDINYIASLYINSSLIMSLNTCSLRDRLGTTDNAYDVRVRYTK